MTLPKVTIITPTFNRAAYLKIAMESVLSCGYPNLQYIIVDDASPDNTAEIVQTMQQQYPNVITYLRNEQNCKESASINRGWQMAEGDYVATLSDDDVVLPNWFDVMIPFMEQRPQLIVGYPDWHLIDTHGSVIKTTTMPDYDFVELFATCASAPGPGVVIRKSLVGEMPLLRDPKYVYLPDYLTWITLALKADFARIPHITACWRHHAESITVSANLKPKAAEMETIMNAFVHQNSTSLIVRNNANKLLTKNLFQIFYMLCKGGEYGLALKYALRALTKSPYWSYILACCYTKRIISGLREKFRVRVMD